MERLSNMKSVPPKKKGPPKKDYIKKIDII